MSEPILSPVDLPRPELLAEIARLKADRDRMARAMKEVADYLDRRAEWYRTLDLAAGPVGADGLSLRADVLRRALPVEGEARQ